MLTIIKEKKRTLTGLKLRTGFFDCWPVSINMTEVLLYVNEELTCTVIFDDDEDATVESFRKNILNEQVDDILSFP